MFGYCTTYHCHQLAGITYGRTSSSSRPDAGHGRTSWKRRIKWHNVPERTITVVARSRGHKGNSVVDDLPFLARRGLSPPPLTLVSVMTCYVLHLLARSLAVDEATIYAEWMNFKCPQRSACVRRFVGTRWYLRPYTGCGIKKQPPKKNSISRKPCNLNSWIFAPYNTEKHYRIFWKFLSYHPHETEVTAVWTEKGQFCNCSHSVTGAGLA